MCCSLFIRIVSSDEQTHNFDLNIYSLSLNIYKSSHTFSLSLVHIYYNYSFFSLFFYIIFEFQLKLSLKLVINFLVLLFQLFSVYSIYKINKVFHLHYVCTISRILIHRETHTQRDRARLIVSILAQILSNKYYLIIM